MGTSFANSSDPYPDQAYIFSGLIHTHYYNSNLIWHTVSHLVDEVIPWGSPETRSVEGDPYGMTSSTRRDTVRQIKFLL